MTGAEVNLRREVIFNYNVTQGDTLVIPDVTYRIDGDLEDFSGCVFTMIIWKQGPIIKQIIPTSDSAGVLSFPPISSDDTGGYMVGDYQYKIWMVKDGIRTSIQKGVIRID